MSLLNKIKGNTFFFLIMYRSTLIKVIKKSITKCFRKKKKKKKATLPEKVKENKGRKEKKLRSDKRKQEKINKK